MTALRLVVFDVDGTLVDSQEAILAGIAAAMAAVERPMPAREQALSIVGLSLPVALARLAPGADVTRMVEGCHGVFSGEDAPGIPPLYPGARAVLDGLAAEDHTLLGIATGKARRGLDKLLAGHGLTRHFLTTQVADDHPSKPHPAMLEAALAAAGVAPAQAVMIGDASFDMEMGAAAGVPTIGVTWGYHGPDRLRDAGAGVIVSDYAELAYVLERRGIAA
ncbi:HAD family hydrolase [Haematobacter missouriensis]|uniref:HAD family hydrolase n=1 Tax=Haematobacter missouriensis TaxID=366616 RepID=A0A212APH8_9RHOB|nr:HAD-IA family hydrolase [Haematobacter missouriensis]KFI27594.1 HAD family hydrolase [Haematobacter missouriensis]OWJ76020.1 HAD family hydrolase [Haematobacter missouriensis]OWJ83408.1 HAD family hydrolase [Haematobacter missouriensis]